VDEYAASGAMCGGVICAHLGTAAQVGHLLAPSAARYDDAAAASITLALPGDQSHRRGVLSAALTGGTFMAAIIACLLVDPVYGLCTSQTHGSNVRRRGRAGGGGVSGAALTNLLAVGIILSKIAGARADAITTSSFQAAVDACLETHPVDGLCVDGEYGKMPGWDVSGVTDMSYAFREYSDFNADISGWDVSSATTMSRMFFKAAAFDEPINDWDTSKVTNMRSMFNQASAFDQPINDWDTSSVTTMYMMFTKAAAFDQPLNDWDTSEVTSMYRMFYLAAAFDQPLNNWDTSQVTSMYALFSWAARVGIIT
jgi:surface protein